MNSHSHEEVYTEALLRALAELSDIMEEREQLDERREAIDRRITKLRRGAIGLGALCGRSQAVLSAEFPELFPDSIDPDKGLTDAVREILKAHATISCSPVFIRDQLKLRGYDLTNYKNALASIHTVLKRLRIQEEVSDTTQEGRTVYRWKGTVVTPDVATVKAETFPPKVTRTRGLGSLRTSRVEQKD